MTILRARSVRRLRRVLGAFIERVHERLELCFERRGVGDQRARLAHGVARGLRSVDGVDRDIRRGESQMRRRVRISARERAREGGAGECERERAGERARARTAHAGRSGAGQ